MIEAKAGRVTRVFTGAPEGLWDVELTPETLRAGLPAIGDHSAARLREAVGHHRRHTTTHHREDAS